MLNVDISIFLLFLDFSLSLLMLSVFTKEIPFVLMLVKSLLLII